MICPDCKGSGTYTGLTVVEPCRTCNGTGSVRDGGEERGKGFVEPLTCAEDPPRMACWWSVHHHQ